VDGENRRARKLTIWAVIVWGFWLTMLILSIELPMIAKATANNQPPPAQSAVVQDNPTSSEPALAGQNGAMIFVKGVVFFLVAMMFCGLPLTGIVLIILMILSRRTASLSRIRASLASIETQLKLLAISKPPSGS
jgi:hypothetical protein